MKPAPLRVALHGRSRQLVGSCGLLPALASCSCLCTFSARSASLAHSALTDTAVILAGRQAAGR